MKRAGEIPALFCASLDTFSLILNNLPTTAITQKELDWRAILDFGTASQVLFVRLRLK